MTSKALGPLAGVSLTATANNQKALGPLVPAARDILASLGYGPRSGHERASPFQSTRGPIAETVD